MRKDRTDSMGAPLKVFLAAAAAAAIAIGLALPVPHKKQSPPRSQFATVEIGGR